MGSKSFKPDEIKWGPGSYGWTIFNEKPMKFYLNEISLVSNGVDTNIEYNYSLKIDSYYEDPNNWSRRIKSTSGFYETLGEVKLILVNKIMEMCDE